MRRSGGTRIGKFLGSNSLGHLDDGMADGKGRRADPEKRSRPHTIESRKSCGRA